MAWQARLVDNILVQGLDVWLVNAGPQMVQVAGPGGTGGTVHSRDDVTAMAPDQQPTLRVTDDQARALLAALLRYYEGGDDTRRLQLDYAAERARVDKLIDAVIDLARQGTLVSRP